MGHADYGGFGVGSDSSWQLQAGVDYRISDAFSARFGYRILKVDYDDNGFRYDIKNDGLYADVGIRF
jgi:opacity protein-like surface antigen